MKISLILRMLVVILCCTGTAGIADDKASLDVLSMKEIPPGSYEVQLRKEGKDEKVKLTIKDNRAKFVNSTADEFEGLSGTFDLIGNGVFLARLRGQGGAVTQFWLFKPDGSAAVKEIPDRGEKQIARRSSSE